MERPSTTRFFHPIHAADKLRDRPVKIELAGKSYALFRGPGGRPAVVLDRCPHRFAPLSQGRVLASGPARGHLQCPYHGWTFDERGRGKSPTQPSLTQCDVASFQVVEKHGMIWFADRATPLSAMPAFDVDGYVFGGTFDMLFQAPLHVALDNFSEDEHTPWVHTRLGWNDRSLASIEFDAENFADRTEVHYAAPQRPSPLLYLLGLRPGDTFHNDWITRFDPVRIEYTISWRAKGSGALRPFTNRAIIFMLPETARTTRFVVFTFLKANDARLAPLLPALKHAARALGWFEVRDDQRFIPTVADTPLSMKGMRLGKFDKPLIHNHKLLERIYWGGAGDATDVATTES